MYNSGKTKTLLLALSACTMLTACSAADRLAGIGAAPEMSKIENPQLQPNYRPVSMPMPAPKVAVRQQNSLWDTNRNGFFKDQRASNVGDILTVLINIDDQAKVNNETERKRDSAETAALPKFLGYENSLAEVLPESIDPTNLVDAAGTSGHKGTGTINRKDQIELKLAAVITQILPNGNFVIHGQQEVRVNFEKRVLGVNGIIRPEDISTVNTINYEQVAEARIVYGGEGQLTDVQQPRYGQQIYDVIMPF